MAVAAQPIHTTPPSVTSPVVVFLADQAVVEPEETQQVQERPPEQVGLVWSDLVVTAELLLPLSPMLLPVVVVQPPEPQAQGYHPQQILTVALAVRGLVLQ